MKCEELTEYVSKKWMWTMNLLQEEHGLLMAVSANEVVFIRGVMARSLGFWHLERASKSPEQFPSKTSQFVLPVLLLNLHCSR